MANLRRWKEIDNFCRIWLSSKQVHNRRVTGEEQDAKHDRDQDVNWPANQTSTLASAYATRPVGLRSGLADALWLAAYR